MLSDFAVSCSPSVFFNPHCCELAEAKVAKASARSRELKYKGLMVENKPILITASNTEFPNSDFHNDSTQKDNRPALCSEMDNRTLFAASQTEAKDSGSHMHSEGRHIASRGKRMESQSEEDTDAWLGQTTKDEAFKCDVSRHLHEDSENMQRETAANQEGQFYRKGTSRLDSVTIMKRSKIFAKQVISQCSAMGLGFVSQIWVNKELLKVMALEVRPSLLSSQVDGIILSDIYKVGDFILVGDEGTLQSDMLMFGCESLVGYELVTEDGYFIGKVRDFTFNLNSGNLLSLEFDSLGFSLIPSNLISTYWMDIEAVMKVLSDKIVLKELTDSHVKRLTKGIWQGPNMEEELKRLQTSKRRRSKLRLSWSQDTVYDRASFVPGELPSLQKSSFTEEISWDTLEKTDLSDPYSPMDYNLADHKR